MPSTNRVPLRGSERAPVAGATAIGPVDPEERIEVTVLLRRQTGSRPPERAAGRASGARRHMSREEFAAAHGADAEDIEKIESFARDHHLDVVEISPGGRRVVLSGTAADLSGAFNTQLHRFAHGAATYRQRTGPVAIPADIAEAVEGVFGLDDRPQAHPHIRVAPQAGGVAQPHAAGGTFNPDALARLYNFPTGVTGAGQTIAIIELGGGYRNSDLETYFSQLGITPPSVVSVSVDGAHNRPVGDPNSADGEVVLDIEVAGAVAPGAKIAVYFAPNTDRGFLDAISQAVHDAVRKPSVVSISWGAAEANWTAQALEAYNAAFQDAAAMGVTVCAAAGDDGSADGVNDGKAHVDFPSSSPYVLACGGTRLQAAAGTISSEVVWSEPTGGATGGGISDVFDLPDYQANVGVPPSANPDNRVGRGVPDVAGDADPQSGYNILVDGQRMVVGGTSAVSPLWSGLVALMNQHIGSPVGFLNPAIYGLAGVFHDITSGSNGAYSARAGWDPCTGLGTPNGTALMNALAGTKSAVVS